MWGTWAVPCLVSGSGPAPAGAGLGVGRPGRGLLGLSVPAGSGSRCLPAPLPGDGCAGPGPGGPGTEGIFGSSAACPAARRPRGGVVTEPRVVWGGGHSPRPLRPVPSARFPLALRSGEESGPRAVGNLRLQTKPFLSRKSYLGAECASGGLFTFLSPLRKRNCSCFPSGNTSP